MPQCAAAEPRETDRSASAMTARAVRRAARTLADQIEINSLVGGSARCVCALAQYLREQASDDPIVPAERSGKA